jgi:ABC-type multidrug transport system fused ATPase/permease subunit
MNMEKPKDPPGAVDPGSLNGTIKLSDVVFAHQPGHPILKGFNLSIEKGTTVAVMGESGAGKTTLLQILLGQLRPQSGEVKVDGKNIFQLQREPFRKQVAIVPQEGKVLPGSIYDNVRMGKPDATDQEIEDALGQASLDLAKFPEGGHRMVSDISVGEQQRVAIARALLRRPAILLSDELTANLDSKTADVVWNNITALRRENGERPTLIIATHDEEIARRADLIVYLKGGLALEQGTYDELVAKRGHFWQRHTREGRAAAILQTKP